MQKRRKNLKARAFSLIELLCTIAVISLLCVIAISRCSFFNQWVLEHEVHVLYMAVAMARERAIATNQEQVITCDPAQNIYTYTNLHGHVCTHVLPRQLSFGYRMGTHGPPAHSTSPIVRSCTFNENTIIFSPTGVVSAGTIYLCTRDYAYLMAITCGVSKISYVRVYHYIDGVWQLVT